MLTNSLMTTLSPLIKGLVLMFFVNIICLRFIFIYGKKKRIGPAVIFIFITILINFVFISNIDKNILQAREVKIEKIKINKLTKAPHRSYPQIKKHTIKRDDYLGSIYALDKNRYKVTLSRENPRQVFQESFYTLTGKENMSFSNKNKALAYAKFVILMYYQESKPIYPKSVGRLGDYLQLRNSSKLRKIGLKIANISERYKNSNKNNSPTIPYGQEWEVDGNVMNLNDSRAGQVLKRISPPKFIKDYDGALLFRLYSFSLRYKELIEWQFKIQEDGEIFIKKLNEIKMD